MKTIYKILRSLILIAIGLALIVPPVLLIALEFDSVQRPVRKLAESELSKVLGAEVTIGSVSVAPFNRAALRNVTVTTAPGDTLASIAKIGVGADLYALIFKQRLTIGFAEIMGMKGYVHRATPTSPTNLQPIIDHLRPKDPSKPPTKIDMAINTIVIRRSSLRYDVDSEPCTVGRFSPHHIHISDLRADIRLPRLKTAATDIVVDVNRFAFAERSGFELTSLSCMAMIDSAHITVISPSISLPNTQLDLSSVSLPIAGDVKKEILSTNFNVALLSGSHITPADLSAFYPPLCELSTPIKLTADFEGTPNNFYLKHIMVDGGTSGFGVKLSDGTFRNFAESDMNNWKASLHTLEIDANGQRVATLIDKLGKNRLSAKVKALISNLGAVNYLGGMTLGNGKVDMDGSLRSAPGSLDLRASYDITQPLHTLTATCVTDGMEVGELLADVVKSNNKLGQIAFEAEGKMSFAGKHPHGTAKIDIDRFIYSKQTFNDIHALMQLDGRGGYDVALNVDDPDLLIEGKGDYNPYDAESGGNLSLTVNNADLSAFSNFFKGRRLSLAAEGEISTFNLSEAIGHLEISDLLITQDSVAEPLLSLPSIDLALNGGATPKRIDLTSDIARLKVRGNYNFKTLKRELTDVLALAYPALFPGGSKEKDKITPCNDFEFSLSVLSTEPIEKLVKLPVSVSFPVEISGRVATQWPFLALDIDAPYLLQGKKLIEMTHLNANIDGTRGDTPVSRLDFTTIMPVKNGNANVVGTFNSIGNKIDSHVGWKMDREKEFSGDINFAVELMREITGDKQPLSARLHFNPGTAVFNDTCWTISPSDIFYSDKQLTVKNFRAGREGQSIEINGSSTDEPTDSIHLQLKNIDLDYVFETLAISNVAFGGCATGNFYASAIFSPSPRLYTDDLRVDGIKYNNCLMGDADIRSWWDMTDKAVHIKADIDGGHKNISTIDGLIRPAKEELDFKFHADDIPVGFMLPFMEAFTSAIDGHASGDAHLFGTFKLLDMTGDIFARDFKLKVDFTNCWYAVTDSVKLRPGRIDIPGVTISDPQGNTGTLSGVVTHEFFKSPCFQFNLTDAKHLLIYDIEGSGDKIWYGHVYGNGGASITGEPGRINIGVNMSTAPGSNFTFVLSDAKEATDYTFLTFRDKTPRREAPPVNEDDPDYIIEKLKAEISRRTAQEDQASIYRIEISVDINPNMLVTLVMDPVGGDRIRARGAGIMQMDYNSLDDDLKLFGRYQLSEGHYNFTLQDIIIKDFTIEDGSSIEFTGNPYAPTLAVNAIYSLTANLSDLDESFLQDKELNRSTVPIQALMNVSGDIRQPNIGFDLRFPTLTDDVYRKVKSIISTDDMMKRQMIYLLALNRFYTPDYMAATKGNELVSVASSTISSQLSNIFGQLSNNWSIAPNFRSDKGDFSDIEVDVALSSSLLNNRLLFNGNLGYRDKSMNNNSFIGDFDIEYLLNRAGTLRLKAYNRYNDRNYYMKNALTTQGVGLIFRRDFDKMFNFLRPKRLKAPQTAENTDSVTENITGQSMVQPQN